MRRGWCLGVGVVDGGVVCCLRVPADSELARLFQYSEALSSAELHGHGMRTLMLIMFKPADIIVAGF